MELEQSSSHFCDYRNELAEKIAMLLGAYNQKPLILGAMADYEIEKQTKSLTVYNGSETDYLIKRFIVAKKVQGCTDRTCILYGRNLEYFFRKVAKSPMILQHTDVQAFIAWLITRNTSKAYQSNIYRTLSSFYAWALKEEIVSKNPMLKVDTIKVKAPHKEAFTDMEMEKIRNACRNNRDCAIVELLFSTGCRVFEITNMKIDDVVNREEIEIIGKGEKPRNVFVNARAQIAITKYLAERKDDNPWLFTASREKGHKLGTLRICSDANWYMDPEKVHPTDNANPDMIRSSVHSIGKRAGVENCHPHRFRRTCATMALRRGMPVTLVQMMLGHESLETTQRYLDIKLDELKQAHKKFVV